MSEDEIIDKINYMINNWHQNVVEIDIQWIQGLLDLYNKEKDSNQWLLKAFDESRNNNIELGKEYYKLQEELKQEKEENKELTDFIEAIEELKQAKKPVTDLVYEMNKFEDEFISKDKIKVKIKELEEKSDYWNCDEIEVLKELLERR